MHETLHTWIAERSDEALHHLRDLVSVNTHSHNVEGLERSAGLLAGLFDHLGTVSVEPTPPVDAVELTGTTRSQLLGPTVRVTREGTGPQVMLIGHHDTVFPSTVDFPLVSSGATWTGPGVADAKGGIVQLWLALGALDSLGVDASWELLIVPDEEIGSPGSGSSVRETARRADIGFGFEPSMPDGSLAAARAGSGNFTVVVRGRAAHAGREHHLGKNAIVAAARLATGLAELTDRPRLLVNPGVVAGGTAVNIVPDTAVLHFNVRATDANAVAAFSNTFEGLVASVERDGIEVSLHGGFGRPPKPRTPAYEALMDSITLHGSTLGIDLRFVDTGGVCDGNLMADEGCVNVDNLGPVGGNLHQVGEYLEIDTLVPRATLTASLIASAGELIQKETPS